ncbi:MAG: HNH endonuclease [Elainellaceae cyanobacterium]
MDEMNQMSREILREHDIFQKISKESHLKSKDRTWALYESWRDSDQGKQWKEEFLKHCEYRCPECNRRLTEFNITIDHKLPRRKYPWLTWDVSNFWILCRDCNKSKGQMDWSKYVERVRRVRGEDAYERVKRYSPC